MASETFVIKARGLPWSATAEEVVKFFSDVKIISGEDGVHFTYNNEGRPSGECFVEITSTEDMEKALAHNDEHMGRRYIEVKEAKHSEMDWVVNRMASSEAHVGSSDGVVRLRGLPYGCSKQDIADFFAGLEICPYGITITMDQDGRASGDAYVEFATPDDAEKAMGKHKEKIGHRYIEVFRSSKGDIKYVVGRPDGYRPSLMNLRPSPYDRPQNFGGPRARGRGGMNLGPSGFNTGYDAGMRASRGGKGGPMRGGRSGGMGGGGMGPKMEIEDSTTGHSVHMRGLPFEASDDDVMMFFSPLNPVAIRIRYEGNRAKGECDVDFATHADAEMAMQKDKQNMGHRYIELFLKSASSESAGWSNNNNVQTRGDGTSGPLMNRGGSSMGGGGSYGGGYGGADRMSGNTSSGMNMSGSSGGYGGATTAGGYGNSSYSAASAYNSAASYDSGSYGATSAGYGSGGGYNSYGDSSVSYPNVQTAGSNYFGGSMR